MYPSKRIPQDDANYAQFCRIYRPRGPYILITFGQAPVSKKEHPTTNTKTWLLINLMYSFP